MEDLTTDIILELGLNKITDKDYIEKVRFMLQYEKHQHKYILARIIELKDDKFATNKYIKTLIQDRALGGWNDFDAKNKYKKFFNFLLLFFVIGVIIKCIIF